MNRKYIVQLSDEERAQLQHDDRIRYSVGTQDPACADFAQVRQEPKGAQLEVSGYL